MFVCEFLLFSLSAFVLESHKSVCLRHLFSFFLDQLRIVFLSICSHRYIIKTFANKMNGMERPNRHFSKRLLLMWDDARRQDLGYRLHTKIHVVPRCSRVEGVQAFSCRFGHFDARSWQ